MIVRKRSEDVVVIFFVIPLFIPFGLLSVGNCDVVSVSLEKCCPSDKVLNAEENCVQLPAKYRNFKEELLKRIQNANNIKEEVRFLEPKIPEHKFFCPRKAKNEKRVLELRDGLLKVDSGKGSSSPWIDVSELSSYCLDLALLPGLEDDLEGPFLQTCEGGFPPRSTSDEAFIVKCCPKGQIISEDKVECVPDPFDSGSWLPARFARHPVTGTAFTGYHENVLEGQISELCPEKGRRAVKDDEPLYFLTNGSVLIRQGVQGRPSVKEYECADRLLIEEKGRPSEVSSVVSVRCENDNYLERDSSLPEECSEQGVVCVSKCCGTDEVFDKKIRSCEKAVGDFQSALKRVRLFASEFPHEAEKKNFAEAGSLIPDRMDSIAATCHGTMIALYLADPNADLRMLDDGGLYYKGLGVWKSGFCVDHFVEQGQKEAQFSGYICSDVLEKYVITDQKENKTLSSAKEDSSIIPCIGSKMQILAQSFRIAYIIGGCISCFFLAVTLYVYLRLPNLKNLHGKIVLFNVVSILSTNILLVIMFSVNPEVLNAALCKTLGYLTYYAGVAMFAWMSIMCFDLGWTFVRAKIPRKGSDHFKLFLYSLFAWGFPFLLLLFVVAVDEAIIPAFEVKPDVGLRACFLSSVAALQRYFYPPISALLCFNTVMFFITVYALWKTKRFSRRAGIQKRISQPRRYHTAMSNTAAVRGTTANSTLRPESSLSANGNNGRLSPNPQQQPATPSNPCPSSSSQQPSSDTREEMILFVKLFFIMGLSWFTEIAHIQLHGDHGGMSHCNYRTEILLRILQGVNMIRGVFIFLIFIWKPAIWKAVKETHPWLAKCLLRRRSEQQLEASPVTKATSGGLEGGGNVGGGHCEAKRPAKQRLTATEIEEEIEIEMNGDYRGSGAENAKSRISHQEKRNLLLQTTDEEDEV